MMGHSRPASASASHRRVLWGSSHGTLLVITYKHNSGTMWWSIIIHKQNVGSVLVKLGDNNGFCNVFEVRTCTDWAIYKNKIGFAPTGKAFPAKVVLPPPKQTLGPIGLSSNGDDHHFCVRCPNTHH